jgi:hypothetical protein
VFLFVEVPIPPGQAWAYWNYVRKIGGASITQNLARELHQAFQSAIELVGRHESLAEYLSHHIASIANLSLSRNIGRLSSRLMLLTLMLVVLTVILVFEPVTSKLVMSLLSSGGIRLCSSHPVL